MSESSGSKTHPPSPKKLRDAREKGQVAYSSDLAAAIPLAAGLCTLLITSPELCRAALEITRLCITGAVERTPDMSHTIDTAGRALLKLLAASLATLGAIAVTALAASFLQVGPLLTPQPLSPKFESLNPVKGLKQIFFSRRAAVELGKNLLKFVIAGIVAALMVWDQRVALTRLVLLEPSAAAAWVFSTAVHLASAVVLVFLCLSVADLLYQRWQHHKDLMMTYEEAKREYKQEEGDPEHKARRRAMHEEVLLGLMVKEVGSADVVITNPDHVACALRWDGEEGSAPKLVAKGTGHTAQRIKEAAAKAGVPVLRRESLARTLAKLELNTQIPADLYEAVAAVMEWAQEEAQLAGKFTNWQRRERERSEAGDGDWGE